MCHWRTDRSSEVFQEQWAGTHHLAISRNSWGLKPETLRVDQEMTQAGASGINGNGARGPGKERLLWTRPYGSRVHSTLGERWLAVCQKMGKLRGLGPAPSLRTFGCWSKSWSKLGTNQSSCLDTTVISVGNQVQAGGWGLWKFIVEMCRRMLL